MVQVVTLPIFIENIAVTQILDTGAALPGKCQRCCIGNFLHNNIQRVTGLFQMDVGLWSLGCLAIGALAEVIGVQEAVLIGAGVCCAFALPAAVLVRR